MIVMSLLLELNSLMIKYHFKPKRKLSQNFLINEHIISKLIEEASLGKTDSVLEIGCGTGFVTRELVKIAGRVFGIEIDEVLCELLQNEIKAQNFQLLCGDALKLEFPEFNKCVSVPPYHISKKLMRKLLEHNFEVSVLVFQREFAEKLIALPGFPEYSAITVMCQYKTHVELLSFVPPRAFFPKPKAVSAIIKLTSVVPKPRVEDEKLFFSFVSELFRYRKKDLANAIKCSASFILSKFGISASEALSIAPQELLSLKVDQTEVSEFVELFNAFYSFSSK